MSFFEVSMSNNNEFQDQESPQDKSPELQISGLENSSELLQKLLQQSDVGAIENLIKNLDQIAVIKRKEKYREILESFNAVINPLGFATLPDFISTLEEIGLIKAARKVTPLTVRYIDPNNPENTWTGRGKKPLWFVAFVEQGGDISQIENPDYKKQPKTPRRPKTEKTEQVVEDTNSNQEQTTEANAE